MAKTILVVDDDVEIRTGIAEVLEDEGYKVFQAKDRDSCIDVIKRRPPSLILLDLWLGHDENAGVSILEKIKKLNSYIPVVIISGHGNIDIAVSAIKKGAYDFIEKPFQLDRLLLTVNRAIESSNLLKENVILKNSKTACSAVFVGNSSYVSRLKGEVSRVAQGNSRVMILGPNGCMPEFVAYTIHSMSNRSRMPFVSVDCSHDENEDLCEKIFGKYGQRSELSNAHGGTLFLNEVLSLPQKCQECLFSYIQTGMVNGVKINARIICYSSQKNIRDVISEFSNDLYARLSMHEIVLSPVSNRESDISSMLDHYLNNSNSFFGLPTKMLSDSARNLLIKFSWPGDMSQMKNVVEFILLNSGGDVIEVSDLPIEITASKEFKEGISNGLVIVDLLEMPLKEAKSVFEREYIKFQMWRFNGNITQVARHAGIDRSFMYKKMQNLSIDVRSNEDYCCRSK